jgi:hypothetical protein
MPLSNFLLQNNTSYKAHGIYFQDAQPLEKKSE